MESSLPNMKNLCETPFLLLELNMHFPFRLSIMPVLKRCILIALPPPSRSLAKEDKLKTQNSDGLEITEPRSLVSLCTFSVHFGYLPGLLCRAKYIIELQFRNIMYVDEDGLGVRGGIFHNAYIL